ncbi:uncharacterized protein L969DRAFT_91442 [Mixia osmundae IAM 14324]|uniref:Uncharacterized protein n=1 Tax=Mixia osmundae (strain CBS 9802 / IAM 14324 / JCM 22182 / KY 12970) TaxID=764103 RepID=G7E3X0_MIXOS|nr:uncharacterized protein L969DRAFT_91442 [Mixia osmundae IAM 14324]KEI41975.1 hypothetical protein L969DRAFT_91442 [Mixia osmundae IAM 14324]GAA97530.1 hypothetical protein E5Q_04208 [Mixia osmundae IAM 14324]
MTTSTRLQVSDMTYLGTRLEDVNVGWFPPSPHPHGPYQTTPEGIPYTQRRNVAFMRFPKYYPFVDVTASMAGLKRFKGAAKDLTVPITDDMRGTLAMTPWVTEELVIIGMGYLHRDILELSDFKSLFYLMGHGAWPAADHTGPTVQSMLIHCAFYIKEQYTRYENWRSSNPQYPVKEDGRPWSSLTMHDLCHGWHEQISSMNYVHEIHANAKDVAREDVKGSSSCRSFAGDLIQMADLSAMGCVLANCDG